MINQKGMSARAGRLQALAEFRYQVRKFLHFSEAAAQKHGLQPQQHQLLLLIAGAPDNVATTIGYAAERLGLRHHTAVELSNRCAKAGLVVRKQAGSDRRRVFLEVSTKGQKMLEALSIDHARELNVLAPRLIRTLKKLRVDHGKPARQTARRNGEI